MESLRHIRIMGIAGRKGFSVSLKQKLARIGPHSDKPDFTGLGPAQRRFGLEYPLQISPKTSQVPAALGFLQRPHAYLAPGAAEEPCDLLAARFLAFLRALIG